MKKAKRLAPVVQVAERQEQQAAQTLGARRSAIAAAQARLQELRAYRDMYARSMFKPGSGTTGAGSMKEYRVFLANLDRVIGQAEVRLANAHDRGQHEQREWLARRARSKALGEIVSRYEALDNKRREGREQLVLDEHAQRSERGLGHALHEPIPDPIGDV